MAHYFPFDVKLRLLAHSRSFLANQKARNAIVGAENLLKADMKILMKISRTKRLNTEPQVKLRKKRLLTSVIVN